MTAISPATPDRRQAQDALEPPRVEPPRPRILRRFVHPVAAICALQAALSLVLLRSNTAFGDEAEYLELGHLLINHWLHGGSWPSASADGLLSGSPVIYPPLGALADSVGGIAGARILSLLFMLGATVLLYSAAARLVGRRAALFAAAVWALSEPALRLAFATYDPLSVALTALAAWLIVQAGCRNRRLLLATLAAAALALANATAYSGIIIDPVVLAFAFLAWMPRLGTRRALCCVAGFGGAAAACFAAVLTASGSWAGLMSTVLSRNMPDQQSRLLVFKDILNFSGFIIMLAVLGAVVALRTERKQQAALLGLLGATGFLVPAAQLRLHTGWSLDKHLAYGIWFAAMALGYGCDKLIQQYPGSGRRLAAACGVIALAYPGVNGWDAAWNVYHQWANASSFVAAFKPVAASGRGLIYASGQEHIAEYYAPSGLSWRNWNTSGLQLDPAGVPRSDWSNYYEGKLHSGRYGVIALFYATSSFTASRSGAGLPRPSDAEVYRSLSGAAAFDPGQPGITALTAALQRDRRYVLVAVGPYSSAGAQGAYAIWRDAPR